MMPMMYDQWLGRYRDALEDLEDLSHEVDVARDRLENITQGYSDMPGGGDSTESRRNAEALLADKSAEYDRRRKESERIREEIRSFIFSIPGNDRKTRQSRAYLEYYYCMNLGIDGPKGIAKKMEISRASAYNYRDRAMILAEKYYRKIVLR